MQKDDIYKKIKALKLFHGASDAFLARLVSQAQMLDIEKGKLLFLHEETIDRFFIVTKGWIKLFRETVEGTQAVFDVLTEGAMLGDETIFQNGVTSYTAEAIEKSAVISLPLSILKEEVENNPKMAQAVLFQMAEINRQKDKELEHRTIQNAPQRIGCFLLRLPHENTEDGVLIKFPYDKTVLAYRLGMQPETFSRALKKLKQETGVKVHGAKVVMENLYQLSDYACPACSSEMPCAKQEA